MKAFRDRRQQFAPTALLSPSNRAAVGHEKVLMLLVFLTFISDWVEEWYSSIGRLFAWRLYPTEAQWILGWVETGRFHLLEPLFLGNGRTHSTAAFEGVFKVGQSSLKGCDAIGFQMQPLKDAAPEFRCSLCESMNRGRSDQDTFQCITLIDLMLVKNSGIKLHPWNMNQKNDLNNNTTF